MTFCWHQRFWFVSAISTLLRGCGCEPPLAVRSVLQSGLSQIQPHRYAAESSFRMPPMSSSLLNGKSTVPFLIPVADGTMRRRSPRERSEHTADLRPVPSKEFPVMAGCSSGTGLPQLTPTSFIRWYRGCRSSVIALSELVGAPTRFVAHSRQGVAWFKSYWHARIAMDAYKAWGCGRRDAMTSGCRCPSFLSLASYP